MVVTAPVTVPTARIQERVAMPSTCTVQAPHCAMPQPNLVPVSPMTSRSTQRRGISGGMSTVYDFPLTVSDIAIGVPSSVASITDMYVAEHRLCMPQHFPITRALRLPKVLGLCQELCHNSLLLLY